MSAGGVTERRDEAAGSAREAGACERVRPPAASHPIGASQHRAQADEVKRGPQSVGGAHGETPRPEPGRPYRDAHAGSRRAAMVDRLALRGHQEDVDAERQSRDQGERDTRGQDRTHDVFLIGERAGESRSRRRAHLPDPPAPAPRRRARPRWSRATSRDTARPRPVPLGVASRRRARRPVRPGPSGTPGPLSMIRTDAGRRPSRDASRPESGAPPSGFHAPAAR